MYLDDWGQQLADTVKARRSRPDGTAERVKPDGRPLLRPQERLYELTGTIGAGDELPDKESTLLVEQSGLGSTA